MFLDEATEQFIQMNKEQIKSRSLDNGKWEHHFFFGIKCKYPLCCILYYLEVWTCNPDLFEIMQIAGYEHDYKCGIPPIENNRRVMCPDCILSEVNKKRLLEFKKQ